MAKISDSFVYRSVVSFEHTKQQYGFRVGMCVKIVADNVPLDNDYLGGTHSCSCEGA